MQYTTPLAVKNYLQTDIAVGLDDQVTEYIEAMTEFVDNYIGYPLYSTVPAQRTYSGNGLSVFDVDPVHTITEVLVNDVVVTPIQLPYNKDVKTELKLSSGTFGATEGGVKVTGIFSLAKTLPVSVKQAVTILTALVVRQVKDQSENVQSEKIGNYSVSFRSEKDRLDYEMAMKIIESYKPISF